MCLLRTLLYCYCIPIVCKVSEGVIVEVEQGILEGEILEVSTGGLKYYSFKGIPYAAPPIGKLSFKAPKPPLKWKGIRSAKEHGSQCVQRSFFSNDVKFGSEDCLFLNVYSPNLNPKKLMSVVIYIHGGGFTQGSGDSDVLGPDFLVQDGIVLVTINYRLGPLGFLCLNTKEVPGNAALKDQVAAMRWVKRNIVMFGGDPENVTIMGQSAGAVAVTLHTVSPMAKGLFKRCIAMSGTFLHDYALSHMPVRRAFSLGRQLGLETRNITELYEFLLNAPLKEMFSINPNVLIDDEITAKFHTITYFAPVVEINFGDEHVIVENPEKLLRLGKVNVVDLLAGHTNDEAIYIDAKLEKDVLEYYPVYHSLLVSVKIKIKVDPIRTLGISDQVLNYYIGNKTLNAGTMKEIIQFDTDNHYVYDVYRLLNAFPGSNDRKKYAYTFSYYSDRNIYSKTGDKFNIKGAAHTDDLLYLFDRKTDGLSPVNQSSNVYKIIQRQCRLFTNFAKYGNPTPDRSLGVTWNQYSSNCGNKLIIGEELETAVVSYKGFLGFWRNILNSVGIMF